MPTRFEPSLRALAVASRWCSLRTSLKKRPISWLGSTASCHQASLSSHSFPSSLRSGNNYRRRVPSCYFCRAWVRPSSDCVVRFPHDGKCHRSHHGYPCTAALLTRCRDCCPTLPATFFLLLRAGVRNHQVSWPSATLVAIFAGMPMYIHGYLIVFRGSQSFLEYKKCSLTNRWSGRVKDKVPSSYIGVRAAQLNR